MRLFLKDQLPLFVLYIAQLVLITLIYWLDGYRKPAISLYAVLLSTAALGLYLGYRYAANRTFYRRLEQPLTTLSASPGSFQPSPLPEALHRLLQEQARLYQADLLGYRSQIEAHIQFINQWAHQMKTPLSVIHLLLQERDDPQSSAIGDELDKLRKGLDMVLYTARLDSFEQDLHVESLELGALIRRIVSDQRRLFIRNRLSPRLELEAAGVTVVSDEKWLVFVITQLLTNAVRYTIADNAVISFRARTEAGRAVLEVEDAGVGIPDADLPRVFDPYFTGTNGRAFAESTGMGLYLARQICDKLGHQIEIASVQGEGTRVRITF